MCKRRGHPRPHLLAVVVLAAVVLAVQDGDLVETARFASLMNPPPDVPVTPRDFEAKSPPPNWSRRTSN